MNKKPTFTIHLTFKNGSNPYVYFNKTLQEAARILEAWSVCWILYPQDSIEPKSIWNFLCEEREGNGMSFTEFWGDVKEELSL